MAAVRRTSELALRFPGVTSIPVVEIAALPTPVQRIIGSAPDGVGALWAKRDDRSAATYGGNKVRKLEYLLGEAVRDRRRAVITFGAVGSNHVLATAVHGAGLGLDVHAILTPQSATPYLPVNVRAGLSLGATLHVARDAEDAHQRAGALRGELSERDGIEPLVIPMGGTSPVGVLGFVNAALELAGQVERRELPEPDVVYVPLGSMGTAAGLAIGFAAVGMKAEVVGVRVVPASIANEQSLSDVIEQTVALLQSAEPAFPAIGRSDVRLEVREGFFGEGYAVATPEGRAALGAAERWGLLLETTYTGKALAALLADASAGALLGRTVLFWNTYNSQPLRPAAVAPEHVPAGLRAYLDEGDAT